MIIKKNGRIYDATYSDDEIVKIFWTSADGIDCYGAIDVTKLPNFDEADAEDEDAVSAFAEATAEELRGQYIYDSSIRRDLLKAGLDVEGEEYDEKCYRGLI